jgi:hypothetical protein
VLIAAIAVAGSSLKAMTCGVSWLATILEHSDQDFQMKLDIFLFTEFPTQRSGVPVLQSFRFA